MIKVTPEIDRDKITALCKDCGAAFEENCLCYFIYVDGEIGGICLFKLTADGGRIIALRNTPDCADRDALIIGGRACLDFIERKSGFYAYFEDEDAAIAKALGFTEKEDKLYLDLHGYFGGCCGCNKK